MSRDHLDARGQRIQAIFDALVDQRLACSLEKLDASLAQWRSGECGALEAHREVMGHVARADAIATALGTPSGDNVARLLRSALDAGLTCPDEFRELTERDPDEVVPHELERGARVALPDKRVVVERLLEEGPILVHLDARREGVQVPTQLGDDACLVLRFGYGLTPAIVDLDIGEKALVGTLTFSGQPFTCVLPWTAVYAAVSEADQRGMVWPDDVPPEAVQTLTPDEDTSPGESAEAPAAESAEPERKRRPGHLKLVD